MLLLLFLTHKPFLKTHSISFKDEGICVHGAVKFYCPRYHHVVFAFFFFFLAELLEQFYAIQFGQCAWKSMAQSALTFDELLPSKCF